ncbi:hypothetical protein KDA_10460 [Dictyobacter alpinus]|uniref:Glycosyltransferase RgtA/B/C/D-like domain-containing protein n=1 Tax=Dictyobacter alpinus TaxID=2014873 RepID=A0A402B2I1_9CHLR|nr:glycosyltransferase family 39 protein [Dictyobacter alpinus]GCE25562.1 hypothetical protein KDA_10460 [Dictyobacter alpinus]
MIATSAPKVETRYITKRQFTLLALMARWPLLVILAFQMIISVTTLRNTAFQDEALYLYAGQQIFNHWLGGPPVLDPYAIYFSGYPYFYPVIAGILDKLGGVELARWFSLLCMMGVTACVYSVTQKVFSRNAAIFAAALYVSLASVLFMGRLATYDALCLLLLGIATILAYQTSLARKSWWLAVWIGPLLLMAVTAKYAALLLALPVLGILIVLSLEKQGWWRTLLRVAIVIVTIAILGVMAYKLMDKDVLKGLSLTTTNRVAIVQRSPLELLIHVLQLGGIAYALGIVGLYLMFREKRSRWLALVLFGASLLVPAYHMYKQEYVSLDKHLAFSLFYVMPLVGYTLSKVSGYTQQRFSLGRNWLAGLAIVLLVFTIGTQQAQTIYAGWADTTNLSYQLHTQLRAGSGRYLSEDIEVARYYAEDVSDSWQWNGVNFLYYTDPHNKQFSGNDAFTRAIDDGYFDVVELSFNYQPYQARSIAQQMAATKNYDLVGKVKFQNSFGIGYYYLWHKATPGKGNFTSLKQVRLP